jgi:hypothetical protein
MLFFKARTFFLAPPPGALRCALPPLAGLLSAAGLIPVQSKRAAFAVSSMRSV